MAYGTPKYRFDTLDRREKLSFSGAVTISSSLPSQLKQHEVAKFSTELLLSIATIGTGATSLITVTSRLAVGNL